MCIRDRYCLYWNYVCAVSDTAADWQFFCIFDAVSYTHLDVYKRQSEDTSKVKNFLGNMSVFTRWYAYETRINDIFGDYDVSNKELS